VGGRENIAHHTHVLRDARLSGAVMPVLSSPPGCAFLHTADFARTASFGGSDDDDDFPTASGGGGFPTAGGLESRPRGGKSSSSSSSGKSGKSSKSSSANEKKKKSSSRKGSDKDKDTDKDKDKKSKKKSKKKDEDAEDLLASFGKAMGTSATKSKAFDPLGGAGGGGSKLFDPLGSHGAKTFDPLGGGLGGSTLLGPGLGARSSGSSSGAAASSITSEWAAAPSKPDMDLGKPAQDQNRAFNVLDAARLIQSSGVRQFVETQNSGYNQVRKPGKPGVGTKKEGLADLSILSEESGSNGSSPEPESPAVRSDSTKAAPEAALAASRASSARLGASQPLNRDARGPAATSDSLLAATSAASAAKPAAASSSAAPALASSLGGGKFGNLMFASDLLSDLSAPSPEPEPPAAQVTPSGARKGAAKPPPVAVAEEFSSDFDISDADIELSGSDHSSEQVVVPPIKSAGEKAEGSGGPSTAAPGIPKEEKGITPKSSHSTSSVLSNVHFASELSSLDDAEDSSGFGSGKFGNIRLDPSPPISPDLAADFPVDPVITKAGGTKGTSAMTTGSSVSLGAGAGSERGGFVGSKAVSGDSRGSGAIAGATFGSKFGSIKLASALDDEDDDFEIADEDLAPSPSPRSHASSASAGSGDAPAGAGGAGAGGGQAAGGVLASFSSKFGNLQMASSLTLDSPPDVKSVDVEVHSDSLPSRTPSPGSNKSPAEDAAAAGADLSSALSKFGNIQLASELFSDVGGDGPGASGEGGGGSRSGGGGGSNIKDAQQPSIRSPSLSASRGSAQNTQPEQALLSLGSFSSKFGNLQLASDLLGVLLLARRALHVRLHLPHGRLPSRVSPRSCQFTSVM